MKRIVFLLLIATILVFLPNCGGKGKDSKAESTNAPTELPTDMSEPMSKYADIIKYTEVDESKDIKKAQEATDIAITAWNKLQKAYPDKGPGPYANFKGWANTIAGINSKLGELKTTLAAGDSAKAHKLCLDVEDFIVAMHKDLQMVTVLDRVLEMRRLMQEFNEKDGDEKKMVVTQMNDMCAKMTESGLPKPPTATGKEDAHKQMLDNIINSERNYAEAGKDQTVRANSLAALVKALPVYVAEFM
jgi:hypothetical protein